MDPEDFKKVEQAEYSRYEAALESAKKKGCVVVVPKANELFVDIDTPNDLMMFQANIARVQEHVPCTWVQTPSPSKRRGRFHIVVTLERDVKDSYERILLQALLGSDLVREILSWQRAQRGDPVPTLFFELEKS